jgi:hypothetical protein
VRVATTVTTTLVKVCCTLDVLMIHPRFSAWDRASNWCGWRSFCPVEGECLRFIVFDFRRISFRTSTDFERRRFWQWPWRPSSQVRFDIWWEMAKE